MRRFKGILSIFFIMALALLIGLAFFALIYTQKISLFSYDERIDMTIILDNAGSGILNFLNSAGEKGYKRIEILAAKGQGFDDEIEQTLENLKEGINQKGFSLKALVSETEVKSYGTEPPEGADLVETDIPMPCNEGGDCKGRVNLGIW